MLYKPKYCCNCGEKIERVEWNLLTSRRFCEVCSIENRRHDLAPRIAVAVGLLALMFGFGSLWRGSGGSEQHSLSLPASTLKGQYPPGDIPDPRTGDRTQPAPSSVQGPNSPTGPAEITSIDRKPSEAKFYCGALTKKGTPCSRKVKAK
jgi:hypothetical protein